MMDVTTTTVTATTKGTVETLGGLTATLEGKRIGDLKAKNVLSDCAKVCLINGSKSKNVAPCLSAERIISYFAFLYFFEFFREGK